MQFHQRLRLCEQRAPPYLRPDPEARDFFSKESSLHQKAHPGWHIQRINTPYVLLGPNAACAPTSRCQSHSTSLQVRGSRDSGIFVLSVTRTRPAEPNSLLHRSGVHGIGYQRLPKLVFRPTSSYPEPQKHKQSYLTQSVSHWQGPWCGASQE